MYDTLMQMGRWFGYRPGYLDLTRLYMTRDLNDWFRDVSSANEELRQEFDRMAALGGTPRDYGLRVRSHPSLLITSRVKMRHGKEVDLSYAGDISETTAFHIDTYVKDNLDAVQTLLDLMGAPEENPERDRPNGKTESWRETRVWSNVDWAPVVAFLRGVNTHPAAIRANGKLLAEYIEIVATSGEVTSWTVALIGKQPEASVQKRRQWPLTVDGKSVQIPLIERAGALVHGGGTRFRIQRLLNPRDESIDLELIPYQKALELTQRAFTIDPGRSKRKEPPEIPSGPYIRYMRPPQRGLLLLYLLDNQEVPDGKAPDMPLVAFGVSFPAVNSKTRVKYRVNRVYWEQEYGETL
jgi:hypothetical protein